MYIRLLVLPQEKSESEQRQVVIGPLETGETGQPDNHEEKLLDMFDHLNVTVNFEYITNKFTIYKPNNNKGYLSLFLSLDHVQVCYLSILFIINMKKGGAKTLNLGHNDVVGKVTFGEGCIINPSCSIICEDKNKEIIFGDYNIIEEKAIILVKNNSKIESNVIRIGSYNVFGIKSYVCDCELGDCNVLEPKV